MKPLIILNHIPRTGGTSFIDCLKRNFNEPEIVRFPRGVDLDWTKINCIHGHFNMNHPEIGRCFSGRERIHFTCLREPIARTLSYYYFSEHQKTIDEWLDSNNYFIANTMTKYLGNADGPPNESHLNEAIGNLDIINFGITEYFDAFLSDFQETFPSIFKTIEYERKNVTPPEKKPDINPYQIAKIESMNNLDIELYEYAKSELSETWTGKNVYNNARNTN